jgi:hypothetical protein
MASGSPAGKFSQAYACKCLNVQITSSTQVPSSTPDSERTYDPAYESIFVEDEGIVIVLFSSIKFIGIELIYYISQTHPQITVRTSTRPEPIPGTSQHSRFIVLTCLLCRLSAYRVYQTIQTISLGIQGNESILFLTDDSDLLEHDCDILKSSNGWIQVHKDSIISIVHNFTVFNYMNTSERLFFWRANLKLPLAFILFQRLLLNTL